MTPQNSTLSDAGLAAVRAAAAVCEAVRATMQQGQVEAKGDGSPVTVADYASQAVVAALLEPTGLPLLAEEEAETLRASPLLERVVQAVESQVPHATADRVLAWLTRSDRSAPERSPRHWVLDPIDGTKGFLRGGQYAVALALLEAGEVVWGALACPQLNEGTVFTAARGAGAFRDGIHAQGPPSRIHVSDRPLEGVVLVESVESGHSDHSASAAIATRLGVSAPPVRMDSQAKYGVVAAGVADLYLRLPTKPGYVERVWDHAAGMLCVVEAGGRVTDLDGRALEFHHGAGLERNRGVVASNGRVHDEVLRVAREVMR